MGELAADARGADAERGLGGDLRRQRVAQDGRRHQRAGAPRYDDRLVGDGRSPGRRARSRRRSARRRSEASWIAPAVPSEPLVEASTIVWFRVSPERSRPSSISVAVPERPASAGEPRASRWATITMLPLAIPGREATTFSRVLVPSTVRPLNVPVADAEAVGPEAGRHLCGKRVVAVGAGRAHRVLGSDRRHRGVHVGAVEDLGGQRSRSGALLIGQRECEHHESQRRDGQAGAVDAHIEHRRRRLSRPGRRDYALCGLPEHSARILLVDDEQSIQTLLSYPLRKEGYDVVQATDGRQALDRFDEQPFDLVVLDLMLPRIDGLEVCRRLRAKQLGADHHAHRQVRGDRQGGGPRAGRRRLHHQAVLAARVLQPDQGGAAPRRDEPPGARPRPTRRRCRCGELRIDFPKRSVRIRGDDAQLTYVEFEILSALARAPGRVFTRDMLLARVWGDSAYRDPRTIDVHIRHLREKVEADPKDPEYLFTVRGVGYRFRDTEPTAAGSALVRRTLSLRNRLALVFFTITLLSVAALYLYVAPGLQSRLMGEKLTSLAHSARAHSGPLRRTVGSSTSLPAVHRIIARTANLTGDRVTLLSVNQAQGRPQLARVADSGNAAASGAVRLAVAGRAVLTRAVATGTDVHPGGPDGRGGLPGALRQAGGGGDRLLGAGLRRAAHGQHGPPRDRRRRRAGAARGARRRLPGGAGARAAGQASGAGRQAGRRREVHDADPGRLGRRARPAGGGVQRHAATAAPAGARPQEVHRHRLARAAHAGVLPRRVRRAARGRRARPRDAPALSGPGARAGPAPGQVVGRPAGSRRGWSPARWSCAPRRSTSAS